MPKKQALKTANIRKPKTMPFGQHQTKKPKTEKIKTLKKLLVPKAEVRARGQETQTENSNGQAP